MSSHRIVVDANKSRFSLNLKELLNYKDLFIVLAYRDLRVRYAQTFLGLTWAFLQPAATLLIFTVVFGHAVKIDTGQIPYPLFAMTGMTAWTYFSFVLNQSGNSIITSQEMVKKIYFPRLIIPLSKAVVGFVDLFIALAMLFFLMIYFRVTPSANFIYAPLFLVLTVTSSLGIGIWLSALTIRFRDFQHVVPFMVQFGLYATPIAYTSEVIVSNLPRWAVAIYYLNPMVGVIEGLRWSLFEVEVPHEYSLLSYAVSVLLFVSSLFYFKRIEKIMADIV